MDVNPHVPPSTRVTVKRVDPAYDRKCHQKLLDITGRQVPVIAEGVTTWKARLPEGARLLVVSDPWIADENLGGSLLLRTFYGLLKEQGMPIEWWTVEVGDDPIGRAYHQICYDLYVGLKGEAEAGADRDFSLFQQQLKYYERVLCDASQQLIARAELKDGDQVLLLDINAIGLAKSLRCSAFKPSLLIDNLRIGSATHNRNYQGMLELLRKIGIYDALDVIQHLHPSFITDTRKEVSIGGFCNFADPHNRQIPEEEAWKNLETILMQGRTTNQFADFVSHPELHARPLMISMDPLPTLPPCQHRLFYQAARIDRTKNFNLILQAYARAFTQDPAGMEQTSLVLMMPSPSGLNNAVEMTAIHSVVRELFTLYESLDSETRKHVYIYFIPAKTNDIAANHLFNESFQNIADVHVNVSDAEGLPNAVFDAMSHHKVPLVHASCGMTEQVEHGASGFCTFENSIDELAALFQRVARRDDLAQIGEMAYQRLVSRFHPFRYVRDFIELTLERTTVSGDRLKPSAWPIPAKDGAQQWLAEQGITQDKLFVIRTNGESLRELYVDLRLKYGEDFALLLTILAIQEPDVVTLSKALDEFQAQILVPLTGAFGEEFDCFCLEDRALKIHEFMGVTHKDSFSHDYLPMRQALQNLFHSSRSVGDCNNLTFIFFLLCKYLGQPTRYYMDIYHTFLTVHDWQREVVVDQAYSDRVLETAYGCVNGQLVHLDSGREAKALTHLQILALFLCRQASESEMDLMQREAMYEAALVLDSDIAEIHNNLGDVYFQLGQYQAAQNSYAAAVQRENYNIFFRLNQLLAVFVQNTSMDKEPQLLQEIDSILSIYPQFAEAHYFRYLLTQDPEDNAKAEQYGYPKTRLLFYGREMQSKLARLEQLLAGGMK